ncbi:alpha/beta fold hydrolase [Gryllotalpicola sp.]|uniref:alpha/beta hydrolase family protein n=1 Tax=Gryllotalpicola sp. TaxID=1932787 RepID=UPI002637D09D|nr:alpha/beta fold hydrolase [Gryllotalpicola sp.]
MPRRRLRYVVVPVGMLLGVGAAAAAALAASAVVVARTIVTPPRKPDEPIRILQVAPDSRLVTLSATLDTVVPGRYSFWFDGDSGHARLGRIVARDNESVTREVVEVSFGDLVDAKRGRFAGWWYLDPHELGLPHETVLLETDFGAAPAWRFDPPRTKAQRTPRRNLWAIHVHGRGSRRQEALRAVPIFQERGYTSLVVSYRNDGDGPRSDDGRYGLGSTEWRDVDAALRYAVDNGASHVVLMGWSMGGAIVLQAAARTELKDRIDGIILESSVVDWADVLRFQANEVGVPRPTAEGALRMLDAPAASRLLGHRAPIGLPEMNWVERANELTKPMLMLHSDDDGVAPPFAPRALAAKRPDIIEFARFDTARHTKLWNYDPERWTAVIGSWLDELPTRPAAARPDA